jgi:hypothetical protein
VVRGVVYVAGGDGTPTRVLVSFPDTCGDGTALQRDIFWERVERQSNSTLPVVYGNLPLLGQASAHAGLVEMNAYVVCRFCVVWTTLFHCVVHDRSCVVKLSHS